MQVQIECFYPGGWVSSKWEDPLMGWGGSGEKWFPLTTRVVSEWVKPWKVFYNYFLGLRCNVVYCWLWWKIIILTQFLVFNLFYLAYSFFIFHWTHQPGTSASLAKRPPFPPSHKKMCIEQKQHPLLVTCRRFISMSIDLYLVVTTDYFRHLKKITNASNHERCMMQ